MSKTLLAILTLLAAWSASPEAAAQPLRTVAFVDAVKFPTKAAQAHTRLRASVEEALPSKSLFLVQTRKPIPDCGETEEGMAKVATDTGAQYVLRVAGHKNREYGYEIAINVYSTNLVAARGSLATCDICDPGRMAEVASSAAAELLNSVLKEEAALKEKLKLQAAAPEPAPAPLPPPVVAPPPPPALEFAEAPSMVKTSKHAWIPWTIVGVGAVALGFGIYAIAQDGKLGSSSVGADGVVTRERNSSKTLGIVGTVVGGVLAAGGLTWVLVTRDSSTSVSMSPNHVALNVRF